MFCLDRQDVYNVLARRDYYDMRRYTDDYFLNFGRDLLGDFKQFNISSGTLNNRMEGSRSPLITRELNRYISTRTSIPEFRHYNYSPVPYFGESDNYRLKHS